MSDEPVPKDDDLIVVPLRRVKKPDHEEYEYRGYSIIVEKNDTTKLWQSKFTINRPIPVISTSTSRKDAVRYAKRHIDKLYRDKGDGTEPTEL